MLDGLFRGIFDTELQPVISVTDFLLCIMVSLALGGILALAFRYKTTASKSYLMTLVLLPAAVCVVIMMVNGNIGASVAVAGVFSLTRFRSIPGTAKEIEMIFLAMAAGLLCGMGYLGYATLFTLVTGAVVLICYISPLGTRCGSRVKTLRITIPEDLDYPGLFDDLFARYTSFYKQTSVKTANMGSMFRLNYEIVLKDPKTEKELIDALRVRNGNLEIGISDKEENHEQM